MGKPQEIVDNVVSDSFVLHTTIFTGFPQMNGVHCVLVKQVKRFKQRHYLLVAKEAPTALEPAPAAFGVKLYREAEEKLIQLARETPYLLKRCG